MNEDTSERWRSHINYHEPLGEDGYIITFLRRLAICPRTIVTPIANSEEKYYSGKLSTGIEESIVMNEKFTYTLYMLKDPCTYVY